MTNISSDSKAIDKDWFDTQQEEGLIDFKCAIGNDNSSHSEACEELVQMQALVNASACKKPSSELRSDLPSVSELREKLCTAEAFSL